MYRSNFLWIILSLLAGQAQAFPEMARIGYQNCISCHVSPTGGGVMTPYGRGMAADILSTWHFEGEESIGHGAIRNKDGSPFQTPDWLQMGGESRWIQTYVNTLQATQTQWFPMQNEVEGAVKVGKFNFVGNLDFEGGPPGTPNYGMLFSNRLYGMYNITDEIYVRAGKYALPFGINQPNHMAVISQNLGWGAETESDNFEAGYIGEKVNLIVTGDVGRPDNTTVTSEKGAAINFAYNLLSEHKIGVSAFSGNSNTNTRYVAGPYAIFSFFRKLVIFSQADLQWKDLKDPTQGPEQKGFVSFNRIQYEAVKGVHPYLVHQISYLDSNTVSSRYDSYGGGVMWYPRPHFEFWGEWDKERNLAVDQSYTDTAWIVLHYYL